MLRCIVFWTSFLIDFGLVFAFNLDVLDLKKHVFSFRKNKVFWNIAVRSSHRFWMPFWLQLCFILASKIHQHLSKNRFQEALKNWSILRSIFNWFWLRFGGQVGAMLATFLGPRPPKRPPRPLQDASKTPPRRSKMPPKTLWIAQDGPRGLQTCPGALQTSILTDF